MKPSVSHEPGRWLEVWGNRELMMALLELSARLVREGRPAGRTQSCGSEGSYSAAARWVGFVPESAWPDFEALLHRFGG